MDREDDKIDEAAAQAQGRGASKPDKDPIVFDDWAMI